MAIFLSTFVNPIDSKGRVVVPKEFRLALDNFQGFVAFRSHSSDAVDCFSMDRMEKLSEQIDSSLDPFSSARDSIEAAVFADAVTLRFDKDGRVIVPNELLEHAQISVPSLNEQKSKNSKVAFVGRGKTFQIWNPDKFKKHQEEARAKLLAQKQRD